MAWTTSETSRFELIETMVAQLQVAIKNLVSKQQVRQLLLIKQTEIEALTQRLDDLEEVVVLLQNAIL